MKGKHKVGDTVTLTGTVTHVDAGDPAFDFVTVKVGGQSLTLKGHQLPDVEPAAAETAEESPAPAETGKPKKSKA